MKKKFLCLILSLTMVLSVCVMPLNVAAESTEGYVIKDSVVFSTDFETELTGFISTNAPVTVVTEDDNTYYQIQASIDNISCYTTNSYGAVLEPDTVITFDLRCDFQCVPFIVALQRKAEYKGTYSDPLAIHIIGDADDTWYTYKLEVGEFDGDDSFEQNFDSFVKVFRKVCGADDSTYTQLTESWKMPDGWSAYDMDTPQYKTKDFIYGTPGSNANIIFGYYSAKMGEAKADMEALTKYSIDNFMVAQKNTVISSAAEFSVEEESVTPVFSVKSGCGISDALVITAVYDADGNMVSIDKNAVNISAGLSTIVAPSVGVENIPEDGRVEAMLWNSEDEMQPVAPVSVFGEADVIESSETTDFNYSVNANEITVEGKFYAEAPVTLKVVGDGELVYATQFNAAADGSFKQTISVNYHGDVTVTVSALGEETKTSEIITILNNWDDFKTAFENLNADNADAFFNDFEENFAGFLDVSALDTATRENIGYIASLKDYDEMTNAEILAEVVKLVTEDVVAVNSFMADVAEAREMYKTDEATAIEEMKRLLKSATFIMFDRTSDVICRELLSAISADIKGFINDYEFAKELQAKEEATQIPEKFAGIADSVSMKGFFDEEIDIVGTAYTIKEALGLAGRLSDDTNYGVMFGAYSVLYTEYTTDTNYADVRAAIEFLLDYTEEYKVWTADMATKTSAKDEWSVIKKVFAELDYVTPELADTYFSNETKAYKRLADMGYSTLAEAAADLADADAKMACLEALDAATTATEIKTQVELAKSEGWITLNATVSEEEYERMVGFGFDYFSDILAAYDFAIGPDYAEYSIRDGKGNSEILLTDFSAQGYLITEAEGDYIRFTPDGVNRHTGVAGDTSWLGIIRNNSANAVNYASPNTTITADIRYVTKGMPFMINFAKPAAFSGANSQGMSVALIPRELNVWYTYKFEIGSYTADTPVNDYVNVYVKVKGEDDSKYELLTGLDVDSGNSFTVSDNDMNKFGYIYNLSYSSAKQVDIGYNTYKLKHESWTEDIYNQTVTDMGVVMNVFESSYIAKTAKWQNGNGAAVTELPASGTVTPVYTVKNTGKACFVDSMVVIYDKSGVMVDLICEQKTVATGEGTEISGPTVDVTAVPNGGRMEALLVDKTDRMRPLADMLALGTLPVTEETECAETTFSTNANTVTVEGTLNYKNENVVVTVKDLSDNILSATQFRTVRQGYFRNTIIIDPELEMDGAKVKVLVSTTEGVEEEELVMSLNWKGMKAALDGEITESFFDEFADCFAYYEPFSGADEKEQAKKTVISFADASEKTLMTALVNTFAKAGVFSEMTSMEILDKLVSIKKNIDDGKAEEFVDAVKVASDAETIKALITSDDTKEFVIFDVTDVSNVDAVCEVLASTDADNLPDILEAFENAKAEQKETESNGLADAFKAISNKNDMNAFFVNEDYKAILGLEGVTYTAADAEIMYSVYVHKDYADVADAEVAGAIKFVQDYVNEYNTWTEEINNSQTAADEWAAISKVFGELSFVTPGLADINASANGLAKVYARLSDLGYTKLEDVEADDSDVIAEKLACIDEIDLQANRRNGSSTGYSSLVKEQVKLAADNGWITIDGKLSSSDAVYKNMLKKSYSYLSDIEEAYKSAVSDSGNDDIGGGTGGGGSTGGSSKKDAESIFINEGTQAGGNTGLNINGEGHPSAPFADVTSEYSWAEPSISGLRKYGIVLGDGDGNFRPGANISREEFLSILLKVFDIENKATNVNFSDVKKNEWYYNTVATAYEMGIVKGYTDGRFGIGDAISRADMAVMVCRVMDIMGKATAAEEVGYIFTDYADIPDYAYNAVKRLQQMGLVKGDDFRNFYPTNSLTRAEAAVVLWPVFRQSGSIIQ